MLSITEKIALFTLLTFLILGYAAAIVQVDFKEESNIFEKKYLCFKPVNQALTLSATNYR